MGFGSAAWTVESWVYPITLLDFSLVFDNRGGLQGVGLYLRSGNGLGVANNTASIASGGSVSLNTWSHVAFTRQGGTIRGFINGNLVLSVTDTRTYAAVASATVGGGFGTTQPYTGYISDFRTTKGHARYTENFTPPTRKLGYNNAE
jgi:hypothetical protein